ncbi:TRAP transporter large permease [Marinivivus vitaminiproducens]|uniref:TRAP transporter large permease n=1 Tax=Marinivivus vitaminiproducens TaxID=3035935 RepID=UPI0027999CA7|nr:TRAP transporter large permease [Geminicoccaceae bacterium SCSIO 64248]
MSLITTVLFLALLFLGFPVGYALILGSFAGVFGAGNVPITVVLLKLFQPTQSFPLLAIPFFVLSGALMMSGKLGQQLIGFAAHAVGRFRGGLGQANVLSSAMFGGVSGSAVADASAVGGVMIPWMRREGYPPALAAAITASSSVIAVLIPPSIPLILFATVSNASIAQLFVAGVLPGLMLTGGLMLACYVVARRRGLPFAASQGGLRALGKAAVVALPALLMPAIIIGLLRFGIATPTEVSVIAVAYALLVRLTLYRDLTVNSLLATIVVTASTTGIVMLVIMASSVVGWVLTVENIPGLLADFAMQTLQSPVLIILGMNVFLLVIGMFIDLPAAILLVGPLMLGLAEAVGMDPIQLGVLMVVNLAIGLFTPPVGTTLFIASAISKQRIGQVVAELWPFYLIAFTVLALVSYVPATIIRLS